MKHIFESTHAPLGCMSAHRHRDSYAALVLDGNYVEASIDGRFSCSSGVLTVHPQALAGLARTSPVEAGNAALEETERHPPAAPAPWLSSLVVLLCEEAGDDISMLAHRCGVTPAKFASA